MTGVWYSDKRDSKHVYSQADEKWSTGAFATALLYNDTDKHGYSQAGETWISSLSNDTYTHDPHRAGANNVSTTLTPSETATFLPPARTLTATTNGPDPISSSIEDSRRKLRLSSFPTAVYGYPPTAIATKKWKFLGQGSFGKVFSVYNTLTERTAVLKEIPIPIDPSAHADTLESLVREVSVLEYIRSRGCDPYVLCFEGVYEFLPSQASTAAVAPAAYYIRTEFLGEYETLEALLERRALFFDLAKTKENRPTVIVGPNTLRMTTVMHRLIAGLRFLRSIGVAHRDIKPGNLMVSLKDSSIKYIDLGISCVDGDCHPLQYFGTPRYMAPEVWFPVPNAFEKSKLFYVQQSDLWSLGVVIWELVHDALQVGIWRWKQRQPQAAPVVVHNASAVAASLSELWYDAWTTRLSTCVRQNAENIQQQQQQQVCATDLMSTQGKVKSSGPIATITPFLSYFDYNNRVLLDAKNREWSSGDPLSADHQLVRTTLLGLTATYFSLFHGAPLSLDQLLDRNPVSRSFPRFKTAPLPPSPTSRLFSAAPPSPSFAPR